MTVTKRGAASATSWNEASPALEYRALGGVVGDDALLHVMEQIADADDAARPDRPASHGSSPSCLRARPIDMGLSPTHALS